MFLVIKGNRLPGFEALAEGDEEEEQNNSDRNSDEEEFHLVSSPNRLYLVLKDNNRRHKKITRKAADILFALRIPWGFGLPPELKRKRTLARAPPFFLITNLYSECKFFTVVKFFSRKGSGVFRQRNAMGPR